MRAPSPRHHPQRAADGIHARAGAQHRGHRGSARIGCDRRLLARNRCGRNPPTSPRLRLCANSIAVLPFDNLSPDPDDAYFAVGIHEEILSQLTKLGDLRVASRTSVQGYAGTQKPTPEIARELNVETVLDGSVRYADGQVLVTVHLSDGATNATLWSESYEHEFSNIFAIQSEIALNVARALKAELLPAERERVTRVPTTSLRAYDLYLRPPLADSARHATRHCLRSKRSSRRSRSIRISHWRGS